MKLRNLLLIFIFLNSLGKLVASDYYGGSIYYKSIGNNQYEVTAKLVSTCNISMYDSAFINASDSNGIFKTELATLVSEVDITGYGSNAGISRCYSGNLLYGFVERTYKDTFDLSGKGCEVYFSMTKYSRPSSISTVNLGSAALHLSAFINQCDGNGNSSPEFITSPKILIDANSEYHQNWGVFEANSTNEYVIELDTPRSSFGSVPTYFGSNSPMFPFKYIGFPNSSLPSPFGFHFDNETGDLQTTPNQFNEVSVVKVKAKEFKDVNGTRKLIGYIERDMVQINIADSNKTPTLDLQDDYYVCIGDTLRLNIKSQDNDSNDFLTINYFPVLQGNVVVSNYNTSSKRPGAFFEYAPTANDFNKLRFFVFGVTDTSTNGVGKGKSNVYTSRIHVVKKPEFTFTAEKDSCSNITINVNNITDSADIGMTPSGETRVYDYNGNLVLKTTSTIFQINKTGAFRIEYTGFGRACDTKKDTVIIISKRTPYFEKSDTLLCRNENYDLTPSLNYYNLQNSSLKWLTGNAADTFATLSIYDSLVQDTGNFVLQITDNMYSCVYNLNYNFVINNIPDVEILGQSEFCPYDTAKYLVLESDTYDSNSTYLWLNFNYNAPLLTVLRPLRDTTVYLKVTNNISKCSDTFSVDYRVLPITPFQMTSDTTICGGNSVDLRVFSPNADSVGIIGYGASTTDSFKVKVAPSNGVVKYYGFILDSNSCFNFDSTIVTVGGPQISIPNDTVICRGDTIQLIGTANNATSSTWLNLLGQDIDTIIHISDQIPFQIYYYTATDALGCNTKDSVKVINNFVKAQVGVQSNYCISLPFDTLGFHFPYGGILAGNGFSNDTFFPSRAGLGYHKFTYTYTYGNSCSYVYEDSLRVWDVPVADFNMSPDTGRAPLVVNFFNTSTEADYFIWYFGGVDSVIQGNPTYTFNDTGLIQVILFAGNPACGFDSVSKYVEVWPAVLSTNIEIDNSYKIYPNPSNQFVYIENEKALIQEIKCIDLAGKLILEQRNINEKQVKLDLSGLPAALYILEIKDSNAKITYYKIQINR